jgi:hypothetical protein
MATAQLPVTLWTSRDIAAVAHVRHTASVCTVAGFEFKRLRVRSLGKLKRLNHGGKRLPYCTVWWLPSHGETKLPEALRTQRDIRHRYQVQWRVWGALVRVLGVPKTRPKRARRS